MKLRLHASWSFSEVSEIRVREFPCVVGRSGDCDIHVPIMFVSRRHCRFTCSNGQIWVQDLESRNGTFVNGESATRPLPLNHGDELSFGPLTYFVDLVNSNHDTIVYQC